MKTKTIIWVIASVILPLLLLYIAKTFFGVSQADINGWMTALDDTVWAIPVTIILFCLLAFIGAPQWMLVAGAILAFGTVEGSILSWFASLCSASLGFFLGQILGAERLSRVDDKLVQKLSNAVRKNGFMTSLVVRLVPTGPAILVNLAAGVSRMKYRHFLSGTAIGIIPKILIIALVGQGIISGLSGSYLAVGFAALAIIAISLSWIARRRLVERSVVETKKTQ